MAWLECGRNVLVRIGKVKGLKQYFKYHSKFLQIFLNLIMTATQIKIEIQKILDNVPENALQDVLDFLKELQLSSVEHTKLANNLRQILAEDKELLQKLAQ
ncbi:hypothetical protein FW774_16220 [Pedobacter sp. BS3]|nr:hypothetical protein FW774_16220 [Pedobacter sp. BS3]